MWRALISMMQFDRNMEKVAQAAASIYVSAAIPKSPRAKREIRWLKTLVRILNKAVLPLVK
tara:strand:+ start:32 stop:214 length:183 start_codon:yes stop_codon:yes gene_type:complete